MDEENAEQNTAEKMNDALHEAVGMHGGWVMAVEVYDEEGRPQLAVMWDDQSTAWARLGMVRALQKDLEAGFE